MFQKIIKIIFLLLMVMCFFPRHGVPMEIKKETQDILRVRLETEKNSYSVDERINIRYIIENLSNERVVFVAWDKGYVVSWIKMYDSHGILLPWKRIFIYEFARYLDREKYIEIPKGKKYVVSITGYIRKNKEEDLNKLGDEFEDFGASSGKVKNIDDSKIWIEFDDSLIALKDVGEYTLKGVYEGLGMWKKDGERLYNLDNIWTGKIESNEIRITIRRHE